MAEILADQQSRVLGDQLATKQDIVLLRGDLDSLRSDITAMEQRIKDQLTIRPGSMLAAAVVLVGALVALF
jgi:hypothetical protein